MAYGIYNQSANVRQQADDWIDWTPDTAKGAALSVAVLLVGSALFLTILKRSGFRAMVAVGRS